ncbi:MAG: hypothetical protein PHQ39_11460 [Methanothrix soehngenii]|nr:hypothetical protein [Methanothrix soehngenii]
MSPGAGDTIPASLLPFSILENHNLYLDQFYYYFESNSLLPFAREIDGHLLSFYPIVTPVLITPLYVLAFLFIKINNIPLDMFNPAFGSIVLIMGKLSSSLIASFSAIFVFLSLKELTNKRIATIVTLIFAFAANTWAISSKELWQHGLVELFLAMSIYLVLINEKQKSKMNIIYLGLISGFFIFNRPPDSILLIPIIYYILTMKDRRIIYYFSFMALSSAPFFLYNMHYFGSFFGGYADLASTINLNYKMITGFVGLLASPSRGIFIYTPIIIFSIAGYLKVFKLSNNIVKNFLLIFGISILGQILIYSAFVIWWGGWSYGPRFLTGMLPVLFIFLGLYLKDTHMNIKQKKNLLKILIFSILLIWSIFVQFVGAFYYPNGGWDGSPSVDLHPERLWHWNDTQIMRSFNAGITSPGNCIKTLQTIIRYTNSVSLQANNYQYVCAELGGGDGVVANRDSVGAWEKFRLIDLGAGYAALRAQNGQYLCAEGGGGGAVVANRNSIGAWETFQVVELGSNRIALRAANGKYLCAEGGGAWPVVANRGSIGAWESFYRTYR